MSHDILERGVSLAFAQFVARFVYLGHTETELGQTIEAAEVALMGFEVTVDPVCLENQVGLLPLRSSRPAINMVIT